MRWENSGIIWTISREKVQLETMHSENGVQFRSALPTFPSVPVGIHALPGINL
jgi:hypothetical protein